MNRIRLLISLALLGFYCTGSAGARTSSETLLIRNITLIDGTGAEPLPNASVLIVDGLISKITTENTSAPEGATEIGGDGKYLMPGLIDSHMHLPGGRTGPGNREMIMDTDTGLKVLHGFLYAGVTAVYDSGNHDKYIYKMRSDSLAGRIVSPRIYATGSLVAKKNGYACCAGATTMDGFEDGKVKLDALFANKPDMLKFTRDRRGMGPRGQDLPLIPDDDFSQLIRYAKDNGVRTTIHIADEEAARLAIAAGVDALAHPVFLADASTGFAEYVADQGVVISSTALLFGAVGRVELDNTFFDDPLFTETLTEEERQFNKVTERNRYASSGMSGWMRGVLPAVLRNLKQLHDAGAIIAMGTDRLIGPMVHMEMELLAEAGIPPLDVITLSTLNGAKYIGVEAYLGSIEVGKRADMVILSKDPSVNIRNSRTIERVFINGKEIDRTQLDVAINQN
ncbi:MAG: amidohydrolase family protein [Rhodospirillaceae bacterium]|jgi:imidazolonepropionase-like amidohydrolase